MNEETRQRAFDPFFTTKDVGEGTGMGLATAYGIIKQHGGEVDLWSDEGSGTRFRVWLPATDHHADEAEPATDPPMPPRGSGEVILLVEDDEQVRGIVSETLARRGYEVATAASTEAAERIVGERGAQIALLLTDVVLPEKSGVALFEDIAAMHPGLKVLYMSGYAPAEQSLASHGRLPEPLLRKPFRTTDLAAAVRDALGA